MYVRSKNLFIWIFFYLFVLLGIKVLLVFLVIMDDEVLVFVEFVLFYVEVVVVFVVCNGNKVFFFIFDMGGRGVIDLLGNYER